MSLSAQLLLLPQWSAILLLIGITVSFSIAGFFIVHRFVPVRIRQIHNDVAGFLFATLGVTYGVLLAFVVIAVWEQFNDTKITVQQEGSAALVIYHNIRAFPNKPAADPILQSFTKYARFSSAESELKVGQSTQESTRTLEQLLTILDTTIPANPHEQMIYGYIAQGLNDLMKYRSLRLQAAQDELPSVIWIGVVMGGMITIGFTFLFGTENVWAHIVMISLLAAMTAVVVYIVIEFDHPTMGAVRIGSPEAYSQISNMAESKHTLTSPP